jgi:autotransporter-associated beta strand protein
MKIKSQVRSMFQPLQRCLLPLCAAALLASTPAFAQSTWTGLGADNNWSTSGNWDVAPTFPTNLIFAGTTQLNPNNDLTGGSFGVEVGTNSGSAITFDAAAGAFTLGGNPITLKGGVNFNGNPATVVTQTISMPIYLNGQNAEFNTPSNGVFYVNGGIAGVTANAISLSGYGRTILGGVNSFQSGVYVAGGTLQLDVDNAINSSAGAWGVADYTGPGPAILDLAGHTQTSYLYLQLGNTVPLTNGLQNLVIDSVGGGKLITAGNQIIAAPGGSDNYNGLNGLATIACDLQLGSTFVGFYLGHNPSNQVDLLISGGITNTGTFCLFYGNQNSEAPGVVEITSTNNHFLSIGMRNSITLRLGANNTLPPAAGLQLVSQTGGTNKIDLAGNTNTCGSLTLGAGATSKAGSRPSVIDSVGGGVLKLGGAVTYNAGSAATQNSTSIISATLDLNGANRGFNIADSTTTPVDLLVTGTIINSAGTPGGVVKNSPGTMVLAGTNSYDGATTVNQGILQLYVACLNPAAAVSIATSNNAVLNLNFNSTNIVSAFYTNGVAQPNGVYNAANMPGVISGQGSLQVGAAVTPPTPALLTNSVSGSTLTLTWPSGQSWRLVGQTNSLSTGLNPAASAWFNVPGGIDGSNSISIDPANPTVFYRLVWP